MASPVNAALCAAIAAAFWTFVGYALARRLLPRVLAIGAAPVIGWAVFSATTLPAFVLIGFSPLTVGIVMALCIIAAGASLMLPPATVNVSATLHIPAWNYLAAALLAVMPALAILPKVSAAGVHLADPIFDHAKIAIIDAMMRQGVPPLDPVFGGSVQRLAYYYLWHFSAAAVALPLPASGWEADAGLTWFTAFASLTLMMALAVWLSKRQGAALWVVVFAAATSLRTTLSMLFHSYGLEPFLATPNGFAGWLFQSAWVPQHLMSAGCVVAALLLIVEYVQRQRIGVLLTLALVIVAGFESSTYVGGVTFAIAALAAAPILFLCMAPECRARAAIGLAAAALLVIGFTAPFILDQVAMVAARGGATPVTVHAFDVLGRTFTPPALRRLLDVPAYWLILLPVEFPAVLIAGSLGLATMLRSAMPGAEKTVAAVLTVLAATGLCISWLLVSTLGDNNDLSLRAVLPAAMVLIAGAAAGMMLPPRRGVIVATALSGLALSLPDTVVTITDNAVGSPASDAALFAQAPELWAAVRRHAQPAARVANNPLYLQDLTPWPANMSWALLANRSSCFAGREMALALAPLSPAQREAINAQFIRVFDGKGNAADVDDMADKYGCDVVVVVPQDGAWTNDPFASSPKYRLAELRDSRWRFYTRTSDSAAAR